MGFYYDDQLNNKSNTIRLYGTKNGTKYTDEPLAKAIFNEDFEFEISNSWSDFAGGNFIEGMFNQVRGYAPYADYIVDKLRKIDFNETNNSDDKLISDISRWTDNFVNNTLANNSSKITEYLNKALVVQGTRFVYFSGTSIGLGNLGMKFILMYDPINNKTIKEQLDPLMEYVIGDYESPEGSTNKDSAMDEMKSFIGWQNPPGGFTMDIKNVQNILKGTMKMEFGDMYMIDNLVCRGCHVSMSRMRVNRPDGGDPTSLYGEVSLAFQPAGMIVKNDLIRYIQPLK